VQRHVGGNIGIGTVEIARNPSRPVGHDFRDVSREKAKRMIRTRRVPILETPVNSSETSNLRRAYISKGLEVNRYVSRGTMHAIFVETSHSTIRHRY